MVKPTAHDLGLYLQSNKVYTLQGDLFFKSLDFEMMPLYQKHKILFSA